MMSMTLSCLNQTDKSRVASTRRTVLVPRIPLGLDIRCIDRRIQIVVEDSCNCCKNLVDPDGTFRRWSEDTFRRCW